MPQGKVVAQVGSGKVNPASGSKLWTSSKIYNNSSAYDDASRYQGAISSFGVPGVSIKGRVGSGAVRNY